MLTFFGDGATLERDFHEALNFANILACPVIILCQNNLYAISAPRAKQTSSKTFAQKAFPYDIPGLQVDGNDVLAVHQAVKEAAHRARTEHRPMLIECLTYRLSVHTTVDDPAKYRSKEEEKEWEKRDPLSRFQHYLRQKEVLTDGDLRKAEESIAQRLQAAVRAWEEQAEQLDNHPEAMFEHLYAETPGFLEAQREELLKEWKTRSREKKHG